MDVLLDPSLGLRRDERLATWPSQLRDLFLLHQLPHETRSHRHALAHTERFYKETGRITSE